jgi:hypothetical protein
MEKMDIFIIWHGPRGNAVAAALKDWLPQIVNAFNPWFSSTAQKGSRWLFEIAARLAKARAGIICLTPSALTAPWVLFESGAIAKSRDKTYACTLLIDLKSEDVTYPLAQFTHTPTTRPEFLKLVKDLNDALGKDHLPEAQIEKSFAKWWPDLEETLEKLPPDEPAQSPHRDQQELLAELIDLARQTNAQVADLTSRIAITSFQAVVTPTVPMSALTRPAYGEQVFETPVVPGGISENVAAQASLRHASQPDELPPAHRPKATRESTPDKKRR